MTRRLLALVLAPVLLLGFTSCGSDDTDDALSADEYKAKANSVCAKASARTDAQAEKLGDDPSEDEVRDFLDTSLDDIADQIAEIRALEGPDGLAADVHDALEDADDAIEELRTKIEDDLEGTMASDEDPFSDINERLVDLGLEDCGAD